MSNLDRTLPQNQDLLARTWPWRHRRFNSQYMEPRDASQGFVPEVPALVDISFNQSPFPTQNTTVSSLADPILIFWLAAFMSKASLCASSNVRVLRCQYGRTNNYSGTPWLGLCPHSSPWCVWKCMSRHSMVQTAIQVKVLATPHAVLALPFDPSSVICKLILHVRSA